MRTLATLGGNAEIAAQIAQIGDPLFIDRRANRTAGYAFAETDIHADFLLLGI
jgi:hypothetical protein